MKYRIWDRNDGSFVKNIFVGPNGKFYYVDNSDFDPGEFGLAPDYYKDNYLLCKSSEIQDANGVEIYEFDVVVSENPDSNRPFRNHAVIRYNPYEAYFSMISMSNVGCCINNFAKLTAPKTRKKWFRVVGNLLDGSGDKFLTFYDNKSEDDYRNLTPCEFKEAVLNFKR